MRAIDKLIQNAGIGEGTAWDYLNNQGETILNTNVVVTEVVHGVDVEVGATAPNIGIEITQGSSTETTVDGVTGNTEEVEVDITVSPTTYEVNIGYDVMPEVIPAISKDADNRARYGTDNGVFVPEFESPTDPVAYYILSKT